jgi:ankyrin repeat protein
MNERPRPRSLSRGEPILKARSGSSWAPLLLAAEKGYEEVVKLLLDKGIDVNTHGGQFGNALQAASAGGHEQMVNLLLDKGADIHAQGGYFGNALMAAALKGHGHLLQLLLDKGANINA